MCFELAVMYTLYLFNVSLRPYALCFGRKYQ